MRVLTCEARFNVLSTSDLQQMHRTAKESSVVAVQIFDQRKFKRRDQGFLGVVNIRVSDVLDLELDSQGAFSSVILFSISQPFA
jgi:hypothetical protein